MVCFLVLGIGFMFTALIYRHKFGVTALLAGFIPWFIGIGEGVIS
jgi:hypothetical protein